MNKFCRQCPEVCECWLGYWFQLYGGSTPSAMMSLLGPGALLPCLLWKLKFSMNSELEGFSVMMACVIIEATWRLLTAWQSRINGTWGCVLSKGLLCRCEHYLHMGMCAGYFRIYMYLYHPFSSTLVSIMTWWTFIKHFFKFSPWHKNTLWQKIFCLFIQLFYGM